MTVAEESLARWRERSWWPEGAEARVRAGRPGQDVVVDLGDYDEDHPIPGVVFIALCRALPLGWWLENRGTRVEVHPSGRFAGGYSPDDVDVVVRALGELGFRT